MDNKAHDGHMGLPALPKPESPRPQPTSLPGMSCFDCGGTGKKVRWGLWFYKSIFCEECKGTGWVK